MTVPAVTYVSLSLSLCFSFSFLYVYVRLIDFHYLCRALSLHITSLSLSLFLLLVATPLAIFSSSYIVLCYLTAIISHLFIHFRTPVLCISCSSCSSLFNTFVGLIYPSLITLSFLRSPLYCGTWNSILLLLTLPT